MNEITYKFVANFIGKDLKLAAKHYNDVTKYDEYHIEQHPNLILKEFDRLMFNETNREPIDNFIIKWQDNTFILDDVGLIEFDIDILGELRDSVNRLLKDYNIK